MASIFIFNKILI